MIYHLELYSGCIDKISESFEFDEAHVIVQML